MLGLNRNTHEMNFDVNGLILPITIQVEHMICLFIAEKMSKLERSVQILHQMEQIKISIYLLQISILFTLVVLLLLVAFLTEKFFNRSLCVGKITSLFIRFTKLLIFQ